MEAQKLLRNFILNYGGKNSTTALLKRTFLRCVCTTAIIFIQLIKHASLLELLILAGTVIFFVTVFLEQICLKVCYHQHWHHIHNPFFFANYEWNK
jgi:hypothetical protein